MNLDHHKIYTPEDVRRIDGAAIDESGASAASLMRRAAGFALEQIQVKFPAVRQLDIYAGAGNNGGDGYWLAVLATRAGYSCTVISAVSPQQLSGDALKACRLWESVESKSKIVRGPKLIIDAILGSGLSRPVTGKLRDHIEAINASMLPVVSLDIPSGLHAGSGKVMGVAVRAHVTLSMVALKTGHFLNEAPGFVGLLVNDSLGISARIFDRYPARICVLGAYPTDVRPLDSHKGSFGHVVVVGGSSGMSGAALLAAQAALAGGAGRVTVLCGPQAVPSVAAASPELMVYGFDDTAKVAKILESANAVVVGPGLGRDNTARQLLNAAVQLECSLIIDADALHLLSGNHKRGSARWVLTPHPGEAAALLSSTSATIQQDRLAAVEALASKFDAAVVLKGYRSLLASPTDITAVALGGNPGMATAGSGDVLAGLSGSFLAQGLAESEAVRRAVYEHNLAGDRAAAVHGQRTLCASDLIANIGQ